MTLAEIKSELEKAYNEEDWNRIETLIDNLEDDLYYKLFHRDYVRRTNFEMAINKNFFDGLIPALVGLIVDGDDVVGYVSKAGKVLSDNEFDIHLIQNDFTEK